MQNEKPTPLNRPAGTRDKTKAYAIRYLAEHGDWPTVPHILKVLGSGSNTTIHAALQEAKAEMADRLNLSIRFPELPDSLIEMASQLYAEACRVADASFATERTTFTEELAGAKQCAEAAEARTTELQSELDNSREACARLEKQLDTARTEASRLARQRQELLAQIQAEQEQFQNERMLLEQEKKALAALAERERSHFEAQEGLLMKRYAEEVSRFDNDRSALKKQIDVREQELGALKKALIQTQCAHDALKERMTLNAQTLAEIKQERDAGYRRGEALNQQLLIEKDEGKRLHGELEAARSMGTALRQQLDQAMTTADMQKQRLNQLENKLAALTDENRRLKARPQKRRKAQSEQSRQ